MRLLRVVGRAVEELAGELVSRQPPVADELAQGVLGADTEPVVELVDEVSGLGVLDERLGGRDEGAGAGEADVGERPQAVFVEVCQFVEGVVAAAMGVAGAGVEVPELAERGAPNSSRDSPRMTVRTKRRKSRRGADDALSGGSGGAAGPVRVAGPAGRVTPALPVGRSEVATLAAAILCPLALYVATLPRTVVLEDDGLFLMAGVHLGVAHPPGYPLHTVIVHLFMQLPLGNPAFLGHLSSAVLGALACGAVYACARLLRASPAPALTAAWLFGVSEQFWSQAIVTEVYTLNALLFFTVYALMLDGARHPRRRWPLVCAAVAWGAGLANHWPLMVLATPGLALLLLPVWRDVLPQLPRLLGVAFVSAALPYAWMVWLSHQAPFISFYGALESWSDFWFFFSRQGYGDVDVSPSAGWSDRRSFAGWFAADLVRQTTLPGSLLALAGLVALARRGGLAAAAAAGSGLFALLGNSVVLILLLGFDFDAFRVALFRPYPLICYGVAALWAAVGLQCLKDRLPGWCAAQWPPLARRATAAATLAGAAMVIASAVAGWRANDRSASDFAERHADVVFELLPPGAVLFAFGDATAPLGYYRYVEGRRPDTTLYNLQGLVFDNRLSDPLVPPDEKQRALGRFVDVTERPVFVEPDNIRPEIYPRDRGVRHYGFLLEVLNEGTANTLELSRYPGGERYFLELLDRRPTDRWEQVRRNELLFQYGRYLGLVYVLGSPVLLEPAEPLFERAQDCYACLTAMATSVLDYGSVDHADLVAAWVSRAEAHHDQALRKAESARLPLLQGRLAELIGDAATAAAHYRRSHVLYPHPDNEAGAALRRLGLAL